MHWKAWTPFQKGKLGSLQRPQEETAFTMQTEVSLKQRSEGKKKGIPGGTERPPCEKCPGNKQQIIKLTGTQNRLGDRDGGKYIFRISILCLLHSWKNQAQTVYVAF